MIFGHCQNHQNWTCKRPHQQKKSWFENCFHAKINTILLLYLYQIDNFLQAHLHFFLHFFFTFMENLFKKHPIHDGKRCWKLTVVFVFISFTWFGIIWISKANKQLIKSWQKVIRLLNVTQNHEILLFSGVSSTQSDKAWVIPNIFLRLMISW